MKKKIGFAFLFPLFVFLLYKNNSNHLGDTDRYYHFALSKMLAEKGAFSLPTLPQAEDIGWGNYFPEKEFLFHALTRLGFSLGGEDGVSLISLFVTAGIGVVLYGFGLGFLTPPVAFLCAFSTLFTHSLVFRLLMVRPHVLALFFFALLNFGILRRRPYLTAFAAAGYVMAYHAFYIPLICFGLTLLLSHAESLAEKRARRKPLYFGLAGLFLGLVLNPYFPSQIYTGLLVVKIPFLMSGAMKGAQFGLELYPLGAPAMLKFYFFPFLILGFALRFHRGEFIHRYLLVLTLLFCALAFQTVRAGEYLVPTAGMLFMVVLASLEQLKKIVPAVAMGAAVMQISMLIYTARTEANGAPDAELHEQTRKAISFIPAGAAKVFNCEWDNSAFLLHQRPDLRFVDLLDPSFLFEYRRELHFEREKLRKGEAIDPFAIVRGAFHADFLLCRSPVLFTQLEQDPAFQRVYPAEGEAGIYLFRVAANTDSAFVRNFSGRAFSANSVEEAKAYDPQSSGSFGRAILDEGSVGFEFANSGQPLSCNHLRPDPSEIQRLAGARYLGLGGGQAIRVWRNGRLLYTSGPGFSRAKSVQGLVRLDQKLEAKDQIDMLVCSGATGKYFGAALSLWSENAFAKVCAWKRAQKKEAASPPVMPMFSSDQDSCLGPLAAPVLPPDLK